jgi:hypothetical protein
MAFAMASSASIADTTALRRGPRRAAKRVSTVVRHSTPSARAREPPKKFHPSKPKTHFYF